jgi:hypothetical protein
MRRGSCCIVSRRSCPASSLGTSRLKTVLGIATAASSVTLQAAAEVFSHSVMRQFGPRPGAPRSTRRRDLAIASIENLVSMLGAATRLAERRACR